MRTLGYFLVGSIIVASAACSKKEAPVEEAPAADTAAPAAEEKKAEAAPTPAPVEEAAPAEAAAEGEATAEAKPAEDEAADTDEAAEAPTAEKVEVQPAAGVKKLNIDTAAMKSALEAAKKANAAKAVTEEAK